MIKVAAVVLSAALVVGCGGGGGDPLAAPTAPVAALEPPVPGKGFRLVEMPEYGFAIAVPRTWRDEPLDPTAVGQLQRANPQYDDDAGTLVTQFEAYAADGSGTNVNVVVNPVGGASLEDLQRDYAAQIAESLPGTKVEFEQIRISGRDGLRGTYQLEIKGPAGPRPTTAVQYVVIGDRRVYIATVSLVGREPATRLAEKIGRSLFLMLP